MPTKTLAAAPSVAASGAVGRALAAGLGCRALSCAPGTPAPRHQRARLPETARRALWGRSTPVIAAPREARVPLPRGPDVPVRSLPLPTWVDAMPARYQPYLRLARADKPIGTWLLLWPGCWSIAMVAPAAGLPNLLMLSKFALGAVVMRGAGCTINDMWDRDIDRKVARAAPARAQRAARGATRFCRQHDNTAHHTGSVFQKTLPAPLRAHIPPAPTRPHPPPRTALPRPPKRCQARDRRQPVFTELKTWSATVRPAPAPRCLSALLVPLCTAAAADSLSGSP